MKPVTVIGVVLIVFGIFALAYQGFTYTKHEKDVDIGSIEITHKEKKTVTLPPVLGGLCLAGGVVLVIAGARQRTA